MHFFWFLFDDCSNSGGFGVASSVVRYAFIVDKLVDGVGESDLFVSFQKGTFPVFG